MVGALVCDDQTRNRVSSWCQVYLVRCLRLEQPPEEMIGQRQSHDVVLTVGHVDLQEWLYRSWRVVGMSLRTMGELVPDAERCGD